VGDPTKRPGALEGRNPPVDGLLIAQKKGEINNVT
jgi:hypothetical protein